MEVHYLSFPNSQMFLAIDNCVKVGDLLNLRTEPQSILVGQDIFIIGGKCVNTLGDLCPYLDTKSVTSDFHREDVLLASWHLIIPTPKI